MYDSLTMLVTSNQPKKVLKALDSLREDTNRLTGEIVLRGRIQNLRVKIISNRVVIIGSLAKYYFGNNLETLTREDTRCAIERLSDTMQLDVAQANVYSLEVASNFSMQKPVQIYCQCLGECRYFEKSQYKHGLLYSNSNRSLIFYDKIKELKRRNEKVPSQFDEANLLRYELKLKKRVSRQLSKNEILARQLYEESFYRAILEKWQSEYFRIGRVNRLKIERIEMNSMNSPKKLEKILASLGLQAIGEQAILNYIEENKHALSKLQRSRLKAKIRQLSQNKSVTEPQEAILELDSKIKQTVACNN
jgi:hypothetical protein